MATGDEDDLPLGGSEPEAGEAAELNVGPAEDTMGTGPVLPAVGDEADIPYPQWDGEIDEWCALQSHDDLGNVGRLRARFGNELAYVRHHGWHAWDGRRWDRTGGDEQALLMAHRRPPASATRPG